MKKCWVKLDNFRFRDRFPELIDTQLAQAIEMVNAQFSGVYTLWAVLPPQEAHAKRELCINYLIAWQLATLWPDSVDSIQGTGALPLRSKKVGPITLSYQSLVSQEGSVLSMLTTNEFGVAALTMIQTAPENYMFTR